MCCLIITIYVVCLIHKVLLACLFTLSRTELAEAEERKNEGKGEGEKSKDLSTTAGFLTAIVAMQGFLGGIIPPLMMIPSNISDYVSFLNAYSRIQTYYKDDIKPRFHNKQRITDSHSTAGTTAGTTGAAGAAGNVIASGIRIGTGIDIRNDRSVAGSAKFSLRAGDFCCLEGRTGSGKTTFLYEKFIKNHNYTVEENEYSISWVPQETNMLLSQTICENVLCGGKVYHRAMCYLYHQTIDSSSDLILHIIV